MWLSAPLLSVAMSLIALRFVTAHKKFEATHFAKRRENDANHY